MSLGPEKIILILVVALIVFGPQRLPEIARQVGGMMRELRRMQDSVRGELEQVLHPDFTPPDTATSADSVAIGETDHGALAPGSFASDMTDPRAVGPSAGASRNGNGGDYPVDDITDDGFAGPRTFS